MSLLTYVESYADIRALLGVSDDELADATLALRVYLLSLQEGFNEVDDTLAQASGTLLAQYTSVAAIAEVSRTAAQQRFYNNVRAYSTYYVAADCADTLPMFSPRTITDGKAMVQRHADSPYKDTVAAIKAGKVRALARLQRAMTVLLGGTADSSTAVSLSTYFLVSEPTTDPVVE